MGIRATLDEVDRGRYPPSLLSSLPLDEVKLDRSVTVALDRPVNGQGWLRGPPEPLTVVRPVR